MRPAWHRAIPNCRSRPERYHNAPGCCASRRSPPLRKAALRSREALWTTIGNLLNAFSPNECRNYLVNCGYALE
jgi:hypothetical protein